MVTPGYYAGSARSRLRWSKIGRADCGARSLVVKIRKLYKNVAQLFFESSIAPMRAARLAMLVVCLALSAALPPVSLAADEFPEISKLYKEGKRAEALDRLERFLAANPRDSRARFLKGVILTEQNKTQEAIKVFTDLTVDFPEMPEPYNNLAVLYAGQGDYEKARQALEMAIRTHPSYAVAHENLGDVYATLASRAYDKALQLDKSNTTAQAKLALIRELFPPRTATTTPAAPDAAKSGAAAAATKPAEAAAPAPTAPVAPSPAKPVESAKPPVAAKPAEAVPAPKAAAAPPSGPAAVDETKAVLKTVEAWASAWSNNDPDGYLAFYAPEFKPPKGESRAKWEAERRDRLATPRKIQVSVVGPRVTFTDATTARVKFRQNYTSDNLKTTGRKTLVLVKRGERWLIQQELVAGK
jgi:tetratricopeptide (TPR) repeat protein/ketosteroid isomerase-like protein